MPRPSSHATLHDRLFDFLLDFPASTFHDLVMAFPALRTADLDDLISQGVLSARRGPDGLDVFAVIPLLVCDGPASAAVETSLPQR